MGKLLVPFAIRRNDTKFFSEHLSRLDQLEVAEMRNGAVGARRKGEEAMFRCPECSGHLYPRGGMNGLVAHWAHLGKYLCPLETRRRLTPDEVSGIIFRGRQEGQAHTRLRLLLHRLAGLDPMTEPESLRTNKYDKPEQGTGCYPDVLFRHGGRTIVLEAQLAPVSLSTIATRRDHYDRQGAHLLWVTQHFDPENCSRLFKWDVIADQAGVMFSIDQEIVSLAEADGSFRLRRFIYDRKTTKWSSSIVRLAEIEFPERGLTSLSDEQWARTFKRLWIIASEQEDRSELFAIHIDALLARIGREGEPGDGRYSDSAITNVISTLLSIERGEPVDYRQGLVHMMDMRVPGCFAGRCAPLFRLALRHFQPELLEHRTVRHAFRKAREKCIGLGLTEFDRTSLWGDVWSTLFPAHKLT